MKFFIEREDFVKKVESSLAQIKQMAVSFLAFSRKYLCTVWSMACKQNHQLNEDF